MDLLLPFAKHVISNKVVSIEEVDRGKKCNCICLFCDAPVIAKKGGSKRAHFAHQACSVNDNKACEASFERCIFWMARRLFTESDFINQPGYNLTLKHTSLNLEQLFQVTNAQSVNYQYVEFPLNKTNGIEDTVILLIKGYKLAVSLHFFGAKVSGPFHLDGTDLPHLVLDMSELAQIFKQSKINFKSQLALYLLDDIKNKYWSYHPREIQFRDEFKAKTKLMEDELLQAYELEMKLVEEQRKTKQLAEEEAKQQMIAETKQKRKEEEQIQKQQAIEHLKKQNELKKSHKIESAKRLKDLVSIVESLKRAGETFARECLNCKISRNVMIQTCEYCKCEEFNKINLTSDYTENLEKKYWCWNYVELSLQQVPDMG